MEYGAEGWIELRNTRRTLNAELRTLGLETLESRWNGARLSFWRKLLEGENPLATWVYNKLREEFVLKGKKDKEIGVGELGIS